MERLENISKPTNIDDKTASFDEISSFNKETNTGVNNMLNKPEIIEFVGIEIPKEVFERYKVFLELINDKIPKEEIKKNLNIEKNELIWKGDLNLECITELPENIKFPDYITGSLALNSLSKLPKSIILPRFIGNSLDLCTLLELPENIIFPLSVDRCLYLDAILELPKDTILPEYIGCDLFLQNIIKLPNKIIFPIFIGGDINMHNLKLLPNNIQFPASIGGSLYLNSLEVLPKKLKIKGSISFNQNKNHKTLNRGIECRSLYLVDCPKLYTIENYQIIKYLLDNNKIEEVIGFPTEEIENKIERDKIVEAILSNKKALEYKTYQVLKENITQKILVYGESLIKEVYNELKNYLISLRDKSIQYKNEISDIIDINDYQNMENKLDQIHKEIIDKPRIVRDRLRSLFSNDLWDMLLEKLKSDSSGIVIFF